MLDEVLKLIENIMDEHFMNIIYVNANFALFEIKFFYFKVSRGDLDFSIGPIRIVILLIR